MVSLGKLFAGKPKVMPTHITSVAQFKAQVLESELPVIVDVWSETCAPCKQLAPVLIKVATKHRDRVRVVELSTDAEPKLLAQLAVRATPTIVVFNRGKEMGRMTGFRPQDWFDQMIETEFG